MPPPDPLPSLAALVTLGRARQGRGVGGKEGERGTSAATIKIQVIKTVPENIFQGLECVDPCMIGWGREETGKEKGLGRLRDPAGRPSPPKVPREMTGGLGGVLGVFGYRFLHANRFPRASPERRSTRNITDSEGLRRE